jgi:hypothetical protein
MAQLAQSTTIKGSYNLNGVTRLGIYNFRISDADRTSRYLHFKTNVPKGGNHMIMIEAKGYNYASGQVIDCSWAWYSYSVGNVLLNTALHNAAAGLVPNLIYHSSDNFVCFSAAALDLYFIGVNLNAYAPCPNGDGFATAITASGSTTSAGAFY